MKRIFIARLLPGLILYMVTSLYYPVSSQSNAADLKNQKLTATILNLDSLFWQTYNECTTEKTGQFLMDDVKFYHDKGGITNGKNNLVASIKNNICGNPNQHIRREAVNGTVNVYPLKNGDSIYGAIISGEHYFYVTANNKPEKREGLAKFTQLWLLQNNEWKMSFILSYDHGPAPYINSKQEIKLSEIELKEFEGNYKNPKFGTFNYKLQGSNLVMDGSGLHAILYPESKTMFFMKERDLEFEFIKDEKNKIFKIVVHENGGVVDELIRF
ncbi:MAG: nuclear transport factor 2 family protein [Saprospiraceae bacterium]